VDIDDDHTQNIWLTTIPVERPGIGRATRSLGCNIYFQRVVIGDSLLFKLEKISQNCVLFRADDN
jgi:hypothetical protein